MSQDQGICQSDPRWPPPHRCSASAGIPFHTAIGAHPPPRCSCVLASRTCEEPVWRKHLPPCGPTHPQVSDLPLASSRTNTTSLSASGECLLIFIILHSPPQTSLLFKVFPAPCLTSKVQKLPHRARELSIYSPDQGLLEGGRDWVLSPVPQGPSSRGGSMRLGSARLTTCPPAWQAALAKSSARGQAAGCPPPRTAHSSWGGMHLTPALSTAPGLGFSAMRSAAGLKTPFPLDSQAPSCLSGHS